MNIRNLEHKDIDFALSIINDEGWGYTREELERMLRLDPSGSFVYEADVPLGIITAVTYGSTGVVGHLVVSRQGRGRKIGQSLLKHALGYFEDAGTDSVLLYATDEGKRLYERFGFKLFNKARCLNAVIPNIRLKGSSRVALVESSDLEDIIEIDRRLFGDDRARLLRMLYTEFPEHSFKLTDGGSIEGFVFARRTSVGYDIGPWACMTDSEQDAKDLFQTIVSSFNSGTMFMGTFMDNEKALRMARSLETVRAWETSLMIMGKPRYPDTQHVYGVAAFELG